MHSKLTGLVFAFLAMTLLGAGQASAQGFNLPNMQVKSTAFEDGGIIPLKYTSHGDTANTT